MRLRLHCQPPPPGPAPCAPFTAGPRGAPPGERDETPARGGGQAHRARDARAGAGGAGWALGP